MLTTEFKLFQRIIFDREWSFSCTRVGKFVIFNIVTYMFCKSVRFADILGTKTRRRRRRQVERVEAGRKISGMVSVLLLCVGYNFATRDNNYLRWIKCASYPRRSVSRVMLSSECDVVN